MTSIERANIFRDPYCFNPFNGPLYNLARLCRMTLRLPEKDPTVVRDPNHILGPRLRVRVKKGRPYLKEESIDNVAREVVNAWRTSREGCWGCPAHDLVDSNGFSVCGGMIDNKMYLVDEDGTNVTYVSQGRRLVLQPTPSQLITLREGHCFTLPAQIIEPLTSGKGSPTMPSCGQPLKTEVNT